MAEYIEREAIMREIIQRFPIQVHKGEVMQFVDTFPADFFREPTEDAVFVVRCKDCKYAAQDKIFGNLYCNSKKKCGGKRIEADYYCADGVQKERDNG